jgi:hypothetical protein
MYTFFFVFLFFQQDFRALAEGAMSEDSSVQLAATTHFRKLLSIGE